MNWKRRNQITSYLRSSLWIVPIGALVVEQIFARIVIDYQMLEKLYILPRDLALARIPDSQRLGAA